MSLLPSLKLEVEGILYHLVGGTSDEMLTAVKRLPKREWGEYLGKGNLWVVPGPIEEVRASLSPLQFFESEDERSQSELLFIQSACAEVLQREDEIQAERTHLLNFVQPYSFNSKSQLKARALNDADCLAIAIFAAKKPIGKLVQLEALSVVRAIRLINANLPNRGRSEYAFLKPDQSH